MDHTAQPLVGVRRLLLCPRGPTPWLAAELYSTMETGVIARERELGPVVDSITVPVRYVVASGASSETAVTGRNGYAPASPR
jgi:hypothetical protein